MTALATRAGERSAHQQRQRTTEPGWTFSAHLLWWLIAGCICLTIASLVLTPAIGFDPESWIVWARELLGPGNLDTRTGPSWHPLQVLLIAPFTLLTRGQADVYFWLFIARLGALLCVVSAALVAARFAGRVAGLLAAVLVIVSPWWVYDGTLGAAEPLAGALCLFAVLAHLDDRRRLATALLFLVGLIRPEVWPLLGVYAIWLVYRRRLPWWVLALDGLATLAAWGIPELANAGEGAANAAHAAPASADAVHYASPFLRVLVVAVRQGGWLPSLFVVIAAIATAARLRVVGLGTGRGLAAWLSPAAPAELALLAGGLVWVLVVALETQFVGFAGNSRYLEPALAGLTVVAAVTAVRIARNAYVRTGLLVLTTCLTAGSALAANRQNIRGIKKQEQVVTLMRQELKELNCPGRAWTRTRTAWLAELTGESNQAAMRLLHTPPPPTGWYVSCAPANAKVVP